MPYSEHSGPSAARVRINYYHTISRLKLIKSEVLLLFLLLLLILRPPPHRNTVKNKAIPLRRRPEKYNTPCPSLTPLSPPSYEIKYFILFDFYFIPTPPYRDA